MTTKMSIREQVKARFRMYTSKRMLQYYRSGRFVSKVFLKICFYFVLLSLAFVFLFPFISVAVNSILSPSDILNITVNWVPTRLYWANFTVALAELNYFQFFRNSVMVTSIATVGHVLSAAFIGYGFARYNFPGKNIIFAMVIFTLIVPVQVIIFPLYIQYSRMGWLNTFFPLTVPAFLGFGLRGGLFIFIYRQFYMNLPYELEEAAKIDGCGPITTFIRIVLPISKSSILVAAILSLVWRWNDYFEPNIYTFDATRSMLPSRLPMLFSRVLSYEIIDETSEIILNTSHMYAATLLVILPLLIIFLFLQNWFMEGVERSGLTGQ